MERTISLNTFDSFVSSDSLTVVDFWATWCGPCKRLAPTIEELATEYEGRANIGKCDVEEDDELAMQFQVSSIPTIVFFNAQGEMVQRLVGLQTKAALQQQIDALL